MRVSFAELHSPLFLSGKNHNLKLFAGNDLELDYDREEKELVVTYKGKTARLPSTSVQSYELAPENKILDAPLPNPITSGPTRKIKAQVSGPSDHVFQGEGAGMVRDKR